MTGPRSCSSSNSSPKARSNTSAISWAWSTTAPRGTWSGSGTSSRSEDRRAAPGEVRCRGATRPTDARAQPGASTTPSDEQRGTGMADARGKAEEAKGRVKKAAGDLTDNDDLQREGQIDQASGKAKGTIRRAADRVDEAIDHAKDKLHRD